MQTSNATAAPARVDRLKADFIVLLPAPKVAALRERIEAQLALDFPAYVFQVCADQAELCADRGYCIMPVLATRPDPSGRADMIIIAGHPPAELVRRIARVVADFAAGRSGKLN